MSERFKYVVCKVNMRKDGRRSLSVKVNALKTVEQARAHLKPGLAIYKLTFGKVPQFIEEWP